MATQHENILSTTKGTVVVTKRVSVCPKDMKPHKILKLSNLDRQCPMLMYLIFFYKPSSAYKDVSLSCAFDGLKAGLEETLSAWYPAAGRLRVNNPSSDHGGKLDLWCNNEGAVLLQAVTQVKICELGDLSQYNPFFENLVYKPVVFNGDFSQMPLVVAQVTKFGCGGYSIGIGTSHSLFDGPATYNFLCAWATNSSSIMKRLKRSSEAGSHDHQQHDQVHTPVHERGALLLLMSHQYCSGVQKLGANINNNNNIRAAAIDHLYQLIQAAAINGENVNAVNLDKLGDNFVLKTFHLSGAMIQNLKAKVVRATTMASSFPCSSFELLTAHLWKARTKALGVKKERMVCLQFAVNIRNKMLPPISQAFSGNAYLLASVALKAGELENGSHEALMEKIKAAKNSVNNDYLRAYLEALDATGGQGGLPPIKELTIVSDWTRTPFHKFDFLQVGEAAAYASPLVSPIPQVAYFMQNPIETRGIDVRIGLPPQALDAFSYYFLSNMQ